MSIVNGNFKEAIMVLTGAVLLVAALPLPAGEAAEPEPEIAAAVVKVYARARRADLLSPWQKAAVESRTGSGVILTGERILTNAHVVADAVSIEVRRAGTPDRYPARVSQVGHACDLALLSVEEPGFFDGASRLELGEPAPAQSAVRVYGFPIGGETLSVTSGIVSRLEIDGYTHSIVLLLMSQIDAAINPGNSGGPVVSKGAIAGIATQGLEDADNIGYMIPVPVIEHFLEDVADGRFDGFPEPGFDYQELESRWQRRYLGMEAGETGVLVTRVHHESSTWGALQPGDVLLGVGGLPVANDGTAAFDGLGRLELSYAFNRRQVGETLDLAILRDGEHITRQASLNTITRLVPGSQYDRVPSYLVFGGVLFQPLVFDYFALFESHPPARLLDIIFNHDVRTPESHEVVLVSRVLPHPVNTGFQDWEDAVIARVNGQEPRDLAHLARMVDGAGGDWLLVETTKQEQMVLPLKEARAATREVLEIYGIGADRSPDLRP